MTNDELMEQAAGILFSGFWEGGNGGNFKAPFSNRTERPFEKAKTWRYVCGHLKPHVRMIDFDSNFNAAVQIAKDNEEHCIAIKSPGGPDRGHIYYFDYQQRLLVGNTKMKTVLTLFPIDYKCGQKVIKSTGEVKATDSAGALSKPDGTFRDIAYFNPKEDQTLDEVPFYHLPMKSGTKHDFQGMKEGDGRQDGLFTYMAPMKSAGYSYDEYLTAAKLINEYVFAVPMAADEFANTTRREAWETLSATKESDFFDGRSFRHDKMGDYLLQNNSLKKINGQLQLYQDGAYTAATEALLKMMVKLVPRLTDRQRNEVLKFLNLSADEAFADTGYIGFKNGLYDVSAGVLIPHSPSIVTTNMIPWNYNPDAYSELLDKTLDKLTCNDPEIRSLLEELGGSCLYSGSPMLAGGKAFILTGDKANGKSTFINMLEDLLGELNYSSLGLNFLGTRFHTAELFGKLANLGNDISDTYIEDTATFKQVVTGDTIETERKGKDPFSFKPYCTLVFSANDIPRTKDRTGAVLRRLVIIPFNATFSKDDPDYNPHIREDLKAPECIEYFIRLSIEGLKRVIANKAFTDSSAVQKQKDEYEKENNPVLAFIDDVGEDAIINEPRTDVYHRYEVFCNENGYKASSEQTFVKSLNRTIGTHLGPKRTANGRIKVFVK